jgi:hypothetical protein
MSKGAFIDLHPCLQGPVWVCTTNDALEDVVLRAVAPSQRQQLVFIQNGMLLPWLTNHGLQYNTQLLLYMSGEKGRQGQQAWIPTAARRDALLSM